MKTINIVVLSVLMLLLGANITFANSIATSLPIEGAKVRLVIKKTPLFKAQAFSDKVVKTTKNYEIMEVKAEEASAIMAALEMDKDIESVEVGYVISTPEPISETPASIPSAITQGASAIPNDYMYASQLHWKDYTTSYKGRSNIEDVYLVSDKIKKMKIAVLDSGFRDSDDMVWKGGFNFSSVDARMPRGLGFKDYDSQDCRNGHGQAVGEIIGAITNNGEGTAGIVNADMYAVRVLGCNKEGYLDEAAEGIRWAAGDPSVENAPLIGVDIDVINMSFGAEVSYCPDYLQSAIDYAIGKNISIVVAAGNTGGDAANFAPANCNNVITVGSVDEMGNQSNFTNHGSVVDVSVLGEKVLSAGTGYGYSEWAGTSFSAPIQAGMIALTKTVNPYFTPLELEDFIKETAKPFESKTEEIGAGVGNAKGLYVKAQEMSIIQPVEMKNMLKIGGRCNQKVYFENNINFDPCNRFIIKVNDFPKEGVYDTYVVFKVPRGLDLTVSNGVMVKWFLENRYSISDLEFDTKDYGIQLCTDDLATDCLNEKLVDLKISTLVLPNACY